MMNAYLVSSSSVNLIRVDEMNRHGQSINHSVSHCRLDEHFLTIYIVCLCVVLLRYPNTATSPNQLFPETQLSLPSLL